MNGWHMLAAAVAWAGLIAIFALRLRSRSPVQDHTEEPRTFVRPARWEVCKRCEGLGTVRTPIPQGSYPSSCPECLGDGCVPIYERRSGDHVRPMGVDR